MNTEPYKLDVKHFLAKGKVGDTEVLGLKSSPMFKLDGENILKSFEGEVKLTLLDREILAEFQIAYISKTICARCLKEFDRGGKIIFDREYKIGKRVAEAGELIVDKEFQIEVGGPIYEEVAIDTPMKPLCNKACEGFTNPEH